MIKQQELNNLIRQLVTYKLSNNTLTRRKLAELTGISYNYVCLWLSLNLDLSYKSLERVTEALQLDITTIQS